MSSSGWEKVVILTMAFKDQKIQKKSQSSRIKKEKKKRSVEAWAELRSRLKIDMSTSKTETNGCKFSNNVKS